MPWVWSDDLARILEEDEDAPRVTLRRWAAAPAAFAVPSGHDLHDFARALAGLGAPAAAPSQARCWCGASPDGESGPGEEAGRGSGDGAIGGRS